MKIMRLKSLESGKSYESRTNVQYKSITTKAHFTQRNLGPFLTNACTIETR